jgi:hypothetical protein
MNPETRAGHADDQLDAQTEGADTLETSPVHAGDPVDAAMDAPTDQPDAVECPEEKLAFTRQTGCENDGSVEFCVPSEDATLLSTIQTIACRYLSPSSGRAGCDLDSEVLCFYPTAESCQECGELCAGAWLQICQIAAHPQISAVVATRYE